MPALYDYRFSKDGNLNFFVNRWREDQHFW
jgi:hypothetical protein